MDFAIIRPRAINNVNSYTCAVPDGQQTSRRLTEKMVDLTETSHLGQVGGLSDAVHTTKSNDKGPSLALRLHHISQNVHPSLGLQDLHQ